MTSRVVVARAADQAGLLLDALRDHGLDPVPIPAIEIRLEPAGGTLDAAAAQAGRFDWIVLTSANGARALIESTRRAGSQPSRPGVRCAAVGGTTAAVLERAGLEVAFQPATPTAGALAAELPLGPAARVFVVRGDQAGSTLAERLRARGAAVVDAVGYRTLEAPSTSDGLLSTAMAAGPPDAVVLTSGSTTRGLLALADRDGVDIRSIAAVAVGPETAAEARRAGFDVAAVSPTPDVHVLAETVADVIAATPLEIA
jgi:uroporphyrinogen-III synthase